jgi:hypothetical protein
MQASITCRAIRTSLTLVLLLAVGWLHAAAPESVKLLRPLLKAPLVVATVAAPQNVAAVSAAEGVQLSWQAVGGAANYLVLRSTVAAPAEPAIANLLPTVYTYLDKGFNAAASYQIVAVAADGRRGASAVVSYLPPAKATLMMPLAKAALVMPSAVGQLPAMPVRQVATPLPVQSPPPPMIQGKRSTNPRLAI